MRVSQAISGLSIISAMVNAHSWIRCTDYRVSNPNEQIVARTNPLDDAPPERVFFDVDRCFGYPPSFPSFSGPNPDIGVDVGYDRQFDVNNAAFCPPRDNTYSEIFPEATYTSGSTICVAYPTKNHVADTNADIPDNGVGIYITNERDPLGPDNNNPFPPRSDFTLLNDFNGVHVDGTVDYLGFQNCPNFVNNNDRSLCTMCFELPDNLEEGRYGFSWLWEFNAGQFYSTCWTALVTANGQGGGNTLPPQTDPVTEMTETTTVTEPAVTVNGECNRDGILACTRGLAGRGMCIPTENDGFVCDCEDGFELPSTNQECAFTPGVELRVTFNVLFADILDESDLRDSLLPEIAEILDVDENRLAIPSFEADGSGNLVAVLNIFGQVTIIESTAFQMAERLISFASDPDDQNGELHTFGGFMANTLNVECVNCEERENMLNNIESSSGSLIPSLIIFSAIPTLQLALH